MTQPRFRDRHDAGNQLAHAVVAELETLPVDQSSAHPIVYALPRGGLPIGESIAQMLHCPLDFVVAKKITRPDNPELAIGAVTSDGQVIRSRFELVTRRNGGGWRATLEQAQAKAKTQYEQLAAYRPQVSPEGAIALLVDDGIATGMTMAAAARSLRAQCPAYLLICAPVAPQRMLGRLRHWCDRVVVLHAPESFLSVSRFYTSFPQVSIDEARACLERQNHLTV